MKQPEIVLDEQTKRLLKEKERQRQANEESARKYLLNQGQGSYELQPIQSQVKKMNVVKKGPPQEKVLQSIDFIPKKIEPEEIE